MDTQPGHPSQEASGSAGEIPADPDTVGPGVTDPGPLPTARKRRAGRNLPVAIGSAVVLYAWIIGSLLWWDWAFIAFLVACAVAGSYEVTRAFSRRRMHVVFLPIVIGGPAMLVLGYRVTTTWGPGPGMATVIAALSLMTVAALALRLRGPVDGFMADASASLFTIAYLPMLLATLMLLLVQPDGNMRLILYFLLVPCSDTAAYAVGSLLGRHKMVPHISPGKTWEGTIGAVVVTGVVGALLAPVMIGASWWAGAIIGLLLSAAATVGDLVESMLKRQAGIKDMGRVIPGHGGAMDRLDSLLVAAPLAWLSMLLLVG